MREFNSPQEVFVPIMGLPAGGNGRPLLLGTGFLVGRGPVMSAKHVLSDNPNPTRDPAVFLDTDGNDLAVVSAGHLE
jgi:hypothetical protein